MIDTFLAFLFGVLLGYIARPKDKDYEEQQTLYDRQIRAQEETIQYYKNLCKWHVNQRKENGNK